VKWLPREVGQGKLATGVCALFTLSDCDWVGVMGFGEQRIANYTCKLGVCMVFFSLLRWFYIEKHPHSRTIWKEIS